MCVCSAVSVDCGPPNSSVHGIFQARILECVIVSSRWPSQPRDVSYNSCICRRILYDRATQEAHRNGRLYPSGSSRKDTSWKEGIKTLCPCTLGKHSFPPCYTVKEESENVSMVCSEELDVLFFLRDICIMKTMGRAGSDLAGITVYIGWILNFIRGHTFLWGSFPVPLN